MTGPPPNKKLNLVQERQEIIKTAEIPQPKRRGHYRLYLTRVIYSTFSHTKSSGTIPMCSKIFFQHLNRFRSLKLANIL